MKKFLTKVAAFADDIASYNDPYRYMPLTKQTASQTAGDPNAAGGHEALNPVLEHLLRNVRSRHVRQHFARTPASEYTRRRNVTIQAATYNVGGKKPPPGFRLDDWLGVGPAAGGMKGRWPPGATATPEAAVAAAAAAAAAGNAAGGAGGIHGPDVLAIGFEEIVPLNAGHVMGVLATGHVDAWDRCIATYLNGEEWASQRYGTPASATGTYGHSAAAAAVALLDTHWQGGATVLPAPQDARSTSTSGASVAPAGKSGGGGSTGSGGGGGGVDYYVQVVGKQLVGVYLSVWVRSSLLPEVRGVQVTTVATGFGGYLGNKGAVAARMRLYDSSVVFVAAHLTAGEAEGDEARRNSDVADILRRAVFHGEGSLVGAGLAAMAMTSTQAALISASLGPGHWPPGPSPIAEHDLAIWVGDLNYRICTVPGNITTGDGPSPPAAPAPGPGPAAGTLTDADVRAAIRSGRLEALLAADQLNRERAAGRVFRGWHEGRITFLPTYKFKPGTNAYVGDETPVPTPPGSSSASLAALAPPEVQGGNTPASADNDAAAVAAGAAAGRGGPPEDSEASVASTGTGGANAADAEKHKRRTPAWCDRVLWWARFQAPRQPNGAKGAAPGAAAAAAAGAGAGAGSSTAAGAGAALPVDAAQLLQLAYWRGEGVMSDHKPVSAAFVAEVVSYDRPRIEGLLEAALRHVDMMLQSLRPKVTVEPVVLEAGEWVALGRAVTMRLTLVNTGTVEAMYHFVPPPRDGGPAVKGPGGGKFGLDDERPPLPLWLSATPAEGVLPAGQTADLELTVLVEGGPGGAAARLCASSPSCPSPAGAAATSLDSIVILRIEDSGDKFVSIAGRYMRSFVGMSLDALCSLGSSPALPPREAEVLSEQLGLGPLQLTTRPRADAAVAPADGAQPGGGDGPSNASAAPAPAAAAAAAAVPKEVAALLEALLADGAAALKQPGILVDSAQVVLLRAGEPNGDGTAAATTAAAAAGRQPTGLDAQRKLVRQLERLRLHLDAGSAVPPDTDPHDVAALLLLWCGQLPQPLLPHTLLDAAVAAPPASPAEADALLRRHCGGARLAVVSELLTLLRAALEPSVSDRNGLTAARLAAAVAAWWTPPLAAGAAADAAESQLALLEALLLAQG